MKRGRAALLPGDRALPLLGGMASGEGRAMQRGRNQSRQRHGAAPAGQFAHATPIQLLENAVLLIQSFRKMPDGFCKVSECSLCSWVAGN